MLKQINKQQNQIKKGKTEGLNKAHKWRWNQASNLDKSNPKTATFHKNIATLRNPDKSRRNAKNRMKQPRLRTNSNRTY